jgi:hypothetical protein
MSSVKDLLRGDVVDGSGTANYVSKWSDADTITNSVIYDDGANVGIGTNSPVNKLDVVGNINVNDTSFFRYNGDTGLIGSGTGISGGTSTQLGIRAANDILFATGGASERMRIDASGRVGIGTSSPAYELDIQSTSPVLRIKNTTAPATGGTSSLLFEGINNFSGVSQSFINSIQAGNSGVTSLAFGTSGSTDATATERMRIDASGNVGIGTSSPTNLGAGNTSLDVTGSAGAGLTMKGTTVTGELIALDAAGGLFISTKTNHPLIFRTNDVEKMRITSGGDVLIGATTGAGKITVSDTGNHIHINNSARASTDFWNLDVASTNRFYIVNQAGTGVYINSGGTSWVGSSDLRLKNIHSQITGGLSSICQLNPVKYSWKNDEENTQYIGLIAQEVEAVIPDVVSEDDNGYKGIVYTELIPVLISAIQELKAEIETLKSQK